MKKLMTALAVCLAAGFVSATGGGVVSSNVVGYVTIQQFDGNNAWGGQTFLKVGGGTNTLSSMFNPSDLSYGDTIQFFNGSVFVAYGWNGAGWEDGDLNVVGVDIPDILLPSGSGFYMTTSNPVKISGEVKKGNAVIDLPTGYSLATSAFPVPFNVDNIDFSSLTYGDTVQVWDPIGLAFVAYGWNGTGWEDGDLNPVTGTIAAVGESVFFSVYSTTSFTQNSPL